LNEVGADFVSSAVKIREGRRGELVQFSSFDGADD